MAKQYVQHVSGQGEKFEVGESAHLYKEMWVLEKRHDGLRPCVPKSEYQICEPPEKWVSHIEEVRLSLVKHPRCLELEPTQQVSVYLPEGYCWRWFQGLLTIDKLEKEL